MSTYVKVFFTFVVISLSFPNLCRSNQSHIENYNQQQRMATPKYNYPKKVLKNSNILNSVPIRKIVKHDGKWFLCPDPLLLLTMHLNPMDPSCLN